MHRLWLLVLAFLIALLVAPGDAQQSRGTFGRGAVPGLEGMAGPGDGSILVVSGIVTQAHNYDPSGMETFTVDAGSRGPITVLVPGASDVAAYLRGAAAATERLSIEMRGRE